MEEKRALCCGASYGPSFGNGDLIIKAPIFKADNSYKASYCQKVSYENQIRETKEFFSVEEYEVFQIIKI